METRLTTLERDSQAADSHANLLSQAFEKSWDDYISQVHHAKAAGDAGKVDIRELEEWLAKQSREKSVEVPPHRQAAHARVVEMRHQVIELRKQRIIARTQLLKAEAKHSDVLKDQVELASQTAAMAIVFSKDARQRIAKLKFKRRAYRVFAGFAAIGVATGLDLAFQPKIQEWLERWPFWQLLAAAEVPALLALFSYIATDPLLRSREDRALERLIRDVRAVQEQVSVLLAIPVSRRD